MHSTTAVPPDYHLLEEIADGSWLRLAHFPSPQLRTPVVSQILPGLHFQRLQQRAANIREFSNSLRQDHPSHLRRRPSAWEDICQEH
jgi:hypothetical protein